MEDVIVTPRGLPWVVEGAIPSEEIRPLSMKGLANESQQATGAAVQGLLRIGK